MFFRRRAADPTVAGSSGPTSGGEDPPLPHEVEEVMAEISMGWEFMTREDFNPVTLALELLDNSSNSRDLETFNRFLGKLEKGMDLVVNEHYQAFNNSIETFGHVMDHINVSQTSVRNLQTDLARAKELLICKRPDLLQLWAKSAQYKEMIRMLTAIEELKKAPEQIQRLMQQRHYLNAVRALQSSLKTINGSDFVDISALSDIRQTIYGIRGSMYETILDELHRCLYLKSAAYSQLNVNILRFGNDKQFKSTR
jgi:exocyst complex component 4